MPEHALASRSPMMGLMALRSVTELPIAQRHVLDPEVLRTVAVVDRVGDLTRFNVAEVPELAQVSSPEDLLAPDERGWALGHALSLAVEHGQRLWLSEVTPAQLGFLRTVLEGTDPLRVSRHTLAALREAGVDLVPRAEIVRLLHNPRFLAYATVFIYSSLRALPATFAPGFRGNPWVLWTIDIVTAVPYTWGIIAMVAGRRRRIRFTGFLVTLITFIAPYVYFFLAGDDGHGNQYPGWVIMVVIGLVLATVLLEGGRWLRDVAVARGLRTRAG